MALIPTPAMPIKKGFLKSSKDLIMMQIKQIPREKDFAILLRPTIKPFINLIVLTHDQTPTTTMLARISLSTICLFVILIACSKKDQGGSDSIDPAVSAVLNLPSTPFNYSNQAVPAYLSTPNILGQ